jgi:hypothetical protein
MSTNNSNSVQHAQPSDLTAHTRRTKALLAPRHEDAPEVCPMPALAAPAEEPLNATAEMYLANIGYAIPPRSPYATNQRLKSTSTPPSVA